jgi:hypothetical protein
MFSSKINHRIIFIALIVCAFAGSAAAQISAYVSAETGVDTNPCTRSQPCRQITAALNVLNAPYAIGGTVLVLDSGEYEGFTIGENVKIVAGRGVTAIVTATTSHPETIRIAGEGGVLNNIVLDSLYIHASAGGTAITVMNQVDFLYIENCDIRGGSEGLVVSAPGKYSINNTRFNLGNCAKFETPTSTIEATISNSQFSRCSSAAQIRQNSNVTFRNSVVSNGNYGPWAFTGSRVFIENTHISENNADGIRVSGGSVRISNTSIFNNGGYGIGIGPQNGSVVRSFGNNKIAGNLAGNVNGGSIIQVAQQ